MRIFCLTTVLAAGFAGVLCVAADNAPAVSRGFRIPLVDLSQETGRHVIIEAGTETVYQGHPTTVLLPDGRTTRVFGYDRWRGNADATSWYRRRSAADFHAVSGTSPGRNWVTPSF